MVRKLTEADRLLAQGADTAEVARQLGVGQHRSTQRHTPASQTVEDPDAALRAWLREYAGKHPRWGHRRAYHDARGEGWIVNHKKIQRLWREEGPAWS